MNILPLNLMYTGEFSLAWPVAVKVNSCVAVFVVSTAKSVPTTILFPAAAHMFWQTAPKSRRTRTPLCLRKRDGQSKYCDCLYTAFHFLKFWSYNAHSDWFYVLRLHVFISCNHVVSTWLLILRFLSVILLWFGFAFIGLIGNSSVNAKSNSVSLFASYVRKLGLYSAVLLDLSPSPGSVLPVCANNLPISICQRKTSR